MEDTGYTPAPAKLHPQEQFVPMQPMSQQQTSSNTIVVQQPATMPPIVVSSKPDDYFLLSLLSCIFCNWICGIVALIYSSQVNSAWAAGDINGAIDNSKKAKTWSIVAIVSHVVSVGVSIAIVVIIVIIFVVLAAASAAVVSNSVSNYNDYS